MAQSQCETVQVRVSKQQRELLNLLKSSDETYVDSMETLIESDPEEYSQLIEIAEQKLSGA